MSWEPVPRHQPAWQGAGAGARTNAFKPPSHPLPRVDHQQKIQKHD